MIQINIGDRTPTDPEHDPLGRHHTGYTPGMTPTEIYQAARGCWTLGQRAHQERYALISHNQRIIQAIEITHIDTHHNRKALTGTILELGHPVYDRYVDRPAPNPTAKNPITYHHSDLDHRYCACGCNTPVTNTTNFVQGHDQRAIRDRIRKVGTTTDFLHWFDNTWNQQHTT